MSEPIRIFVSYSHEDRSIIQEIMGFIRHDVEDAGAYFWIDENLTWGSDWDAEIKRQLDLADIALMMISQSFLNSEYIRSVEIATLLQRRQDEGLIILPILLSACLWKNRPWLRATQMIPNDGRNLSRIKNRSDIYTKIAEELIKHVETHNNHSKSSKSKRETYYPIYGILHSDVDGKKWELRRSSYSIGRAFDNQIPLENFPSVSSKHALIEYHEPYPMIKDLNSRNGTFLNDVLVEPNKSYPLKHGDTIRLGKFEIKYIVPVETEPVEPSQTLDLGDDLYGRHTS